MRFVCCKIKRKRLDIAANQFARKKKTQQIANICAVLQCKWVPFIKVDEERKKNTEEEPYDEQMQYSRILKCFVFCCLIDKLDNFPRI